MHCDAERGQLVIVIAVNEGLTKMLSPQTFAAEFGMSLSALAAYAKVDPYTITQAPDTPRIQAFLHDCVLVTDKMQSLFEVSRADVIPWFCQDRRSAFRDRTAMDLVSEGRVDAVLTYFEGIASGFVG